MSLLREQWIKNVSEVWLDPNGIYNKFRKPQRVGRSWSLSSTDLRRKLPKTSAVLFAGWTE
jgi:hypothetical protein